MAQNILFADSCSWCTGAALQDPSRFPVNSGGAGLKYDTTLSQFNGVSIGTTPDNQNAYVVFNCTAIYKKTIAPSSAWADSRSLVISPQNPHNGNETNIWAYWLGSTCVATVTLRTDGRFTIRVGGDGIRGLGGVAYLSQLATALTPSQLYSIDLEWSFPNGASGGWCDLYINDVKDLVNPSDQHSAMNVDFGGVVPDSFSICAIAGSGAQAGYAFYDLVVSKARVGPCKVKCYTFTADQFIQWGLPLPTAAHFSSCFEAISEVPGSFPTSDLEAPDGNASYLLAPTSSTEDLFGIASVDCYASILGIALSACVQISGDGFITFIVRPNPSNGRDIAIPTIAALVPNRYGVQQAITEVDLGNDSGSYVGSGPWLDGHIQNAWWGINALEAGISLTQLVLEKITTRRPVPFQCGKLGSYSFTGTPSVAT
jgi:hypothetical protein